MTGGPACCWGVIADLVALEIDEEEIVLRMIGEALLERQAKQIVTQSHWRIRKNAFVHDGRITTDDRLKLHSRDISSFQ